MFSLPHVLTRFALFFRIVPTKCILSCNKVITRFTPFCSQFLSRLTLFCIKVLTRCILRCNIVLTRCILFTISSDKICSLHNKFWQDYSLLKSISTKICSLLHYRSKQCILSSNKLLTRFVFFYHMFWQDLLSFSE